MDEFMGSPILNAAAQGVAIATKHGEIMKPKDIINIWDDIVVEEDQQPKETNVAIQVVYKVAQTSDQTETNSVVASHMAVVGILMVSILVMVCFCYYNKRVAMKITIENTVERAQD